jgi:F0F1-type ATP synthase membrane subunit c/vacuolar-type H+-ATPase subunit K
VSAPPADVRQGCRHGQLVAAVFIFAVVMYAFFVEMMAQAFAPFRGFAPEIDLGVSRIVLGALAVMSLALGRVLRDKLGAALVVPITPMRRTSAVTRRLFTGSLFTLLLTEAIAVYGLVLFMLGGRRLDFYAFAALSLVAFVVHFPRLSVWEDRARKLSRFTS